jgi:hypothetical protein
MDKSKYLFNKLARRKTGFPIATVAYYGPDDQLASKVVVGIQKSDREEVTELHKWFAKGLDVRQDESIHAEIFAYISANQVQRVAIMDRIIGCPHEEGIDYPMGETCPQCPFWANRDRWTGEIIG